MTINRYCASGLQSIALAAERIRGGGADVIVAGGTESMSFVPMGGNKISINPWLMEHYPDSYLSMGLTAERVAQHYGIAREAGGPIRAGQPPEGPRRAGRRQVRSRRSCPCRSPSPRRTRSRSSARPKSNSRWTKVRAPILRWRRLAKLKPASTPHGTVTAGNSSQTSDGAAAAVVMSDERARALGIRPLARFVAFAYAGCLPEEMGIGPVYAIPKALKLAGLTLDQIDLIELNEAFAAQSLAVIKVLGLDMAKVNVNGGAIALGHPLGCTGAKLTATLLQEMKRRKAKYGMVTMCVGGGMGAAGIFENLN